MTSKNEKTIVYTPRPKLTIYRDTYLKCELLDKDDDQNSRLKIISVHTGRGAILSDLTAERSDEVILVDSEEVYDRIEDLKYAMRYA